MTSLSNLKIGTRLALGFAAVLVFLACIMGLGLNSMSSIQTHLNGIVTSNNVKVATANRMLDSIRDMTNLATHLVLLTDEAASVPPALESFLSDTQPGFEDDPTRAVFNHVWIIGDSEAISIPFQAQVDQLTKLAPVSNATTPPDLTVPGGGQGGGADTSTTIPDLGGAPTTTTPETTTPPDTTGSGAAGGSAGGRGSGQ